MLKTLSETCVVVGMEMGEKVHFTIWYASILECIHCERSPYRNKI